MALGIPMAILAGSLGSAGIGALSNGLSGGGDQYDTPYSDQLLALINNQLEASGLNLDYLKQLYPQLTNVNQTLGPILGQQLSSGGQLPNGLENQVWQLAQRRNATGYNQLSDQLGTMAASRGTLMSGPVFQNWMNQVGLAKAQSNADMATNQAYNNYNYMQDSIKNALSYLNNTPQQVSGNYSSLMPNGNNSVGSSMDYSALGSLFARGLTGLFNNSSSGYANVAGMGTVPVAPTNYYMR